MSKIFKGICKKNNGPPSSFTSRVVTQVTNQKSCSNNNKSHIKERNMVKLDKIQIFHIFNGWLNLTVVAFFFFFFFLSPFSQKYEIHWFKNYHFFWSGGMVCYRELKFAPSTHTIDASSFFFQIHFIWFQMRILTRKKSYTVPSTKTLMAY